MKHSTKVLREGKPKKNIVHFWWISNTPHTPPLFTVKIMIITFEFVPLLLTPPHALITTESVDCDGHNMENEVKDIKEASRNILALVTTKNYERENLFSII